MKELSRSHPYSADLQRVAVRYKAEHKLATSISTLHKAIAGQALLTSGVSFQLYPHLLTEAHPEPGYYIDDITGQRLLFHSQDELRYDIAHTLPQSGKIDINGLSVDVLRRQDERGNDTSFRAILRADLPKEYRQKLEKLILRYAGHRLVSNMAKLSQGALFLMLKSEDIVPELAIPEKLEEKIHELNSQLGGKLHKTGDALASPTVNFLRFMNFQDIGVHAEHPDT